MVKIVESQHKKTIPQPSTLHPRERVRLALRSQEPDRVPIDLDGWATYFTEGAYRNLLRYLKIEEDPKVNDWFLVSGINESILQRFGVDFRRVGLGAPDGFLMLRFHNFDHIPAAHELSTNCLATKRITLSVVGV